MEGPILSICIPTYNRCGLLREGLQALAREMNDFPRGWVEIVISDNASSDDTKEVIEDFAHEHREVCLRYVRQPETINANANIYGVTKLARGEYVFVVSDDDTILPKALGKIVCEIREHPGVGALCPNLVSVDRLSGAVGPPLYQLAEDRWLVNYEEMLIALGTLLTFVSCVVFRRDLVCGREYTDKIMTFFPHSYLFADILASGHGCVIIKQPCLAARGNTEVGYDLVDVFVTKFAGVLEHAERNGLSRHGLRTVLSGHALWVAGFLRQFRKTSYRPDLQGRIRDTAKVARVWWWNPKALLRIEAAMWLPDAVYDAIRKVVRCARSEKERGIPGRGGRMT